MKWSDAEAGAQLYTIERLLLTCSQAESTPDCRQIHGAGVITIRVIVRFIRCTRRWLKLGTAARDLLFPPPIMMIQMLSTCVAIAQTPKPLGWRAARLWTVTRP